MTSIRHVVMINDFARQSGGATMIALMAAEQYRRLGYQVTFISGDQANPALDALGVKQIALDLPRLLDLPAARAAATGIHNTQAERAVARFIEEHDAEGTVYHLHNWSQILSPAVFRPLRKVQQRLVVTCHDFANICPNGGYTHFPQSRPCSLRPLSAACLVSQCDRRNAAQKYWRTMRMAWLRNLARFGDSSATFTFLNSTMQDKFVAGGFPARDLVAIANPVEPWSRERIAAERNEGFLFVGRIGTDKGADLAIAAARATGEKLTLIGPGDESVDWTTDEPNLNFVGWKDRTEIAEIAGHSRGVIVSSRVIEPFGLVILEAAMSGLPVIVSSHAYLAGDVVRAGFGETFDVTDPANLARQVARLAGDDDLVARMSAAGFANAGSLGTTPESWVARFVEIFERKLAARPSPHPDNAQASIAPG